MGLLSRDTGISVRRLKRIIRAEREPTYSEVQILALAISRASRFEIPVAELIVAADEIFPTECICDLFKCRCLPPWAWDEEGRLRIEYEGIPPGKWKFCAPEDQLPNNP